MADLPQAARGSCSRSGGEGTELDRVSPLSGGTETRNPDIASTGRHVTIVVIGGGQAGLSAAYHLQRRGFVGATDATADGEDSFVVLDGDAAPGGAWQHRWRSLRMATVNGIFDLPGMAQLPIDAQEASADVVPRYFAEYERRFDLPILRPVRATSVRRADADPTGPLIVESDHGSWVTRALINATGTWTNPHVPRYPGQETFLGRQLHVAQYVSADEFSGQHVVVVGGGISAVQLLDEISRVTSTTWFTRREPLWLPGEFDAETTGRDVIARVDADVRRGLPMGSIVSYTGLIWTDYARAAAARGALERHPMFARVEPYGVRLPDGGFQPADVILWATGFDAALEHLEPLQLRNELGGIAMDHTAVANEPRVHLIGYGPSQSTVGANRAGRDAARALANLVGHRGAAPP
jgi:cation diffusion facilitator CzcD-associated flavoprotein CzcO